MSVHTVIDSMHLDSTEFGYGYTKFSKVKYLLKKLHLAYFAQFQITKTLE